MQLPKNKSNHKAVVLTADKFEDLEVFFPVFRLLEEGWQVDIAAPGMKEIKGENGNLVTSLWPMDLPAFMREVMKMVKGVEQ